MKKGFIGLIGIMAASLGFASQTERKQQQQEEKDRGVKFLKPNDLKETKKKKGEKIKPKQPPKDKGTFESRYRDFLIRTGQVKEYIYKDLGFKCIARNEKNADRKLLNFLSENKKVNNINLKPI